MTGDDPRLAALDSRLRRMFAALDAREGFDHRLKRRIAELQVSPQAPPASLRAQFERRREIARRRLRRDFRANVVTTAGIGAAGGALVMRHAPEIVRWLATDLVAVMDPMLAAAATFAVLGAGVWTLLGRSRGR